MSSPKAIGLPWYEREAYPRLRAMMVDAHVLAPDYDTWHMAAQNNEQVARQAGLTVMRVPIEPQSFAAWCAGLGLAPDSAARMRFVQEAVHGAQTPPLEP